MATLGLLLLLLRLLALLLALLLLLHTKSLLSATNIQAVNQPFSDRNIRLKFVATEAACLSAIAECNADSVHAETRHVACKLGCTVTATLCAAAGKDPGYTLCNMPFEAQAS